MSTDTYLTISLTRERGYEANGGQRPAWRVHFGGASSSRWRGRWTHQRGERTRHAVCRVALYQEAGASRPVKSHTYSETRAMRTATCWICGSPAPRSSALENNKHTRVECPKCGTYHMDERSHQRLGERIAPQIEAGVEAPHHPNHEALSALIRTKYDASGQQEVFIDDFDALEREAGM
jgi:hypothetical protein